jgi:hypothetical protein
MPTVSSKIIGGRQRSHRTGVRACGTRRIKVGSRSKVMQGKVRTRPADANPVDAERRA